MVTLSTVVPWWGVPVPGPHSTPGNPAQDALEALAHKNELALALLLLTSIQKEIASMTVETDALKAQIARTASVVQQAVAMLHQLQAAHVDSADVVAATTSLKTATDTLSTAMSAIAAIVPASSPAT